MIADVPEETQHVPDGPLPDKPPIASDAVAAFGRYKASETLGAGAMGTVYRARDEMLGRDVAVKTLTASGELGIRERFLREARAIGAVHHPNILAVHDVGEESGTPYLVMELAAGGSLRERIKAAAPAPSTMMTAAGAATGATALPVETVYEIGTHIARALAAAHAANIIHRDVKPANILCSTPSGHAPLWKLADFGIAHVPDSTLTMTGQFLGSPSYAAPESLREGTFGPASDVYSLGATLYEALAGTPPHGDHDMQSLVRKLEQEPTPLQSRVSVPQPLSDAIMAALARDPARRPSAEELARLLAGDSSATAPVASAAPYVPLASAPNAPNAPTAPGASSTIAHAPVPLAPTSSGGPSMKLLGLGLLAIAVLATVLALRGGDSAKPAASVAPMANEPQPQDEAPVDDQKPMVVDQYGNPVDDETAKQILEQMERDARDAEHGPGKGHGRGKHKKDD